MKIWNGFLFGDWRWDMKKEQETRSLNDENGKEEKWTTNDEWKWTNTVNNGVEFDVSLWSESRTVSVESSQNIIAQHTRKSNETKQQSHRE